MVSDTNTTPQSSGFRWLQLVMGIVCMAMIANLQYGWTLFVDPIDAKNHWGRASIQLAFTIVFARVLHSAGYGSLAALVSIAVMSRSMRAVRKRTR